MENSWVDWWRRQSHMQQVAIGVAALAFVVAAVLCVAILVAHLTHHPLTLPPLATAPRVFNGSSTDTPVAPEQPGDCWMPRGCTQEPAPEGPRFQWNVLDVSESQPPYREQQNCGGTRGGAAGGHHQGSVLVCAPAPIVDAPSAAPFTIVNPYDIPVSVASLVAVDAVGSKPQNLGSCYWNTDFDDDGRLLPHAQPALLQPLTSYALSYGVVSEGGSEESVDVRGDNAALAFIAPQCTNHGVFWKQLSAAYPSCQEGATNLHQLNNLWTSATNPFKVTPNLDTDTHQAYCVCGSPFNEGQSGCVDYFVPGQQIQPTTETYFPWSPFVSADPPSASSAPPFAPLAPEQPLLEPKAWAGKPPRYQTVLPSCT